MENEGLSIIFYRGSYKATDANDINDAQSGKYTVSITAGKKLMIFEKVWITETRGKVYVAEHIFQVSKVYDYPRQMRETQ